MRPDAPRRAQAFAALGLGAIVLFCVGLATSQPALQLIFKPIPALALAAWVATSTRDRFGQRVATGLLLSALGDLLLEQGLFLPGLFAFLAAHLAYLAAFLSATRRPALVRAIPFLAWGAIVLLRLWPHLGAMAPAVAVYVVVICTMMWRAAASVGSVGRPAAGEWLGLVGAVLFAASDTLIALDRFQAPIDGVRWPIMALYWAGQWGIAASAVARRSATACPRVEPGP